MKYGLSFTATGIFSRPLIDVTIRQIFSLNVIRRALRIGRNIVDVQFQRIGAGLFNEPCVSLPTAKGRAVQAADDRNAHRLFRFRDVIDVRLRIDLEVRFVGIIVERVRENSPPFPELRRMG